MTCKARQGRTGASVRFPGGNRSSAGAGVAQRSRMPHRGCHRQVTGGLLAAHTYEPFRKFRHCPFLCAHECRCLDGELMGLPQIQTGKHTGREGCGKRIPGTHSVSDIDLRCLYILCTAGREHIASGSPACEYKGPEPER